MEEKARNLLRGIKYNIILLKQLGINLTLSKIKLKNMTFFQWLNGKKTIIGSVFLFLAVFGTEVMQDMWGLKCPVDVAECTYDWLSKAIDTSSWIGMIMGGVGLTHKAYKASK